MNISPIIAIPPLPEGTPQGSATSVPPNPASLAVPEVAAIPAAEGARAADKERQRNERPDDELNPDHEPHLGHARADERSTVQERRHVDAEVRTRAAAERAEAAALRQIAEVAREVQAPRGEDHGHDDPCGPCSNAVSAYVRNTGDALDGAEASARPLVDVEY